MEENISQTSVDEAKEMEVEVSDSVEGTIFMDNNIISTQSDKTDTSNQQVLITPENNNYYCPDKEHKDEELKVVTIKSKMELIFDSLNYECEPVEFLRIGNEEEKKPMLNMIERNNDSVEIVWLKEFIRKMNVVDNKSMNKSIPEAREDYDIKKVWKDMNKSCGGRNFLSKKYRKRKAVKFDEQGRLISLSINKMPPSFSISMDDARHVLYTCVVQILAQVGFYACEESTVVILTDILEDYIKRMCKLLCYNRDREMLSGPTGFPDILIRTFHEMGISDLNEIPQYYKEKIKDRKVAERGECQGLIKRFAVMQARKEIIKEDKEPLKINKNHEESLRKTVIKKEHNRIIRSKIKAEPMSENETGKESSLSDDETGSECDSLSGYEGSQEDEYADDEEEVEVEEEAFKVVGGQEEEVNDEEESYLEEEVEEEEEIKKVVVKVEEDDEEEDVEEEEEEIKKVEVKAEVEGEEIKEAVGQEEELEVEEEESESEEEKYVENDSDEDYSPDSPIPKKEVRKNVPLKRTKKYMEEDSDEDYSPESPEVKKKAKYTSQKRTEKQVKSDSDEDYSEPSVVKKEVPEYKPPRRTSTRDMKRKISYSEPSSESESESYSDRDSDPDYELES